MICNITALFSLNKPYLGGGVKPRISRRKRTPYQSRQFDSNIIKENGVTALVYKSGKVVLVGGKSESQVQETANILCEKLKGKGELKLEFKNYVAHLNLPDRVNLKQLYKKIRINQPGYIGSFEPELFHCFVWSLPKLKAKAIIFESGKVIITGCKSLEEVNLVEKLVKEI